MKLTHKVAQILGAAAFGMTILAAPAAMADTTLAMSSWLPARQPIVINAFKPWAQQVEDVTEGRVKIRILAKPLGPPPAHFDMAADGVADITYGLHSFTTDDRFVRSRIGQFSFTGDDAASGSTALWNVYGGMLDAQAEHEGVKLLGLFVHGPGIFHNNVRKIESDADFAGLKIRVPGGYIADMISDLGAETLFMSTGEIYEKLSRGVIDGVTITYEALTAYKLTEHLKYSMRAPGGFYNSTWFFVMNDDKWAEISAEDQAAIEAISGEAFAALVGNAWNAADDAALIAIADAGIQVYDTPADVLEKIKTIAAGYESEWADTIAADGFDGKAALAELRAQTGVEY